MMVKTVKEVLEAGPGTYVGGGTDLMPLLKNHARDDRTLIFLHPVEELRGVREEDGYVYLGAGETLYDLSVHPLVRKRLPAVAQAAGATASPQIRNIATLGGNIMQDRRCIYFNQSQFWRSGLELCFKTGGAICHQIPNSPVCRAIYYSDVATALLAYEAEAEVAENGERTWLPLSELIRRHSQANGLACEHHLPVLVTTFRMEAPPEGERSGFYKYAMRASIDFPLINFALRVGGGRPSRAVAGAVAPAPVLLEEVAAALDRGEDSEAVTVACLRDLAQFASPIREACISPSCKRMLYQQFQSLLDSVLYRGEN